MKRALLLIAAPVLLFALAFGQTPASINTDRTSIKGCLGGSEGNYTVLQNNTGHIFKIATSGVDLKPHVGHDVTLITHRATGEGSSADNSLVVTELSMISEHCAEAAAAPVATVSTLSETAITPPEAAAPSATVAETAVTPAEAATAPAATTSPVAEIAVAPPEPATPPAAVTPPAETVVTPPTVVAPPSAAAPSAETVVTPSGRASASVARSRRLPAAAPAAATPTPDVTAKSSSETVQPPAAAAATPIATPGTTPEPVTTPDAAATAPTAPTAPTSHWSLYLLIAFAVFVIVLGMLVPSISRWRKQKSLEQTGAPNLSFTREARSDQDKSDAQGPRKAA